MIWNFCIRRPLLTGVVLVVWAIFGVYGIFQLPVQENPDVDFPMVSVSTVLPGASPEVIDAEVIEILEGEINTIEGLRQLTSTSRQGVGQTLIEFELWRDIDIAVQEVRDAIDRVRRRLPSSAEAPVVRKLDLGAQAILWVALTGDQRWSDQRLTEYADTVIKQQLDTLRGVGQIQIGGLREFAVRIQLDPQRLAAHDLSADEVIAAIQANNADLPTGRIEGGSREFLIQTRGQFAAAEPFNDLVIAHRDGSPITLAAVGEAVDGIADDRQLARFAGQPTVGLGVVKTADANTIEVVRLVRERVAELAETFPAGLEYHIATDSSRFIAENIRDLLITILIATMLVVAVVLAFLRSGRGTLVVMLAIPTSLLIGLAVISLLGFSINVLTMLALILAIGIVVDDAIVVLERAHHHLERGAEALPAARIGTTEVAFPNIANSLALAAVFLPVAFTGGLIGRFFLEFGVTVTVTVLASSAVALTLTPVLCSRLLQPPSSGGRLYALSERCFAAIDGAYARLLAAAFRHRLQTIGVGIAAFLIGIVALSAIPHEFAAEEDREQFLIVFETPQGATLGETDRLAQAIEAELAATPEVQHQFLAIGLGQGGPGQPNRGLAFVSMTPRASRDRHQMVVMQELRERLNDLPMGRSFVSELTPGGVGGAPIELILRHPDTDTLAAQQAQLQAWMEAQPEWFVGVRGNLELANPQVNLHFDRPRMAEMGLSVHAVSNTLRLLFGGTEISTIEVGANRYQVIASISGRGQLQPADLQQVQVRAGDGRLIRLDQVLTIEEGVGPSEIHRTNRMRSATVSAQTPPGVALGDAVARLQSHLQEELPAEVDYEMGGMSELFAESFAYLTLAIAFSVIFIYLILVAQFESLRTPLAIMVALPLATTGAFGGLWLAGLSLNVYAFIGLIMLLGLVAKNAILLIDFSNVLVARGHTVLDAAQLAARDRFRPVLMTACSTVLGVMPLALGFGAGGEARMPLGMVVVGGLSVSTLLTLIIIPVSYSLIFGRQDRQAREETAQ